MEANLSDEKRRIRKCPFCGAKAIEKMAYENVERIVGTMDHDHGCFLYQSGQADVFFDDEVELWNKRIS
jgi:hypothetical protein